MHRARQSLELSRCERHAVEHVRVAGIERIVTKGQRFTHIVTNRLDPLLDPHPARLDRDRVKGSVRIVDRDDVKSLGGKE